MTGILLGSVVAKKNLTCSGGSSSVLSRALKAPVRQHMDFVDVVDLEPGSTWAKPRVLAKFTDLLDAVVARSVDFDHVDVLPNGDRLADVAGPVGLVGRAMNAVEALGEDPRDRRFADSSRVPLNR